MGFFNYEKACGKYRGNADVMAILRLLHEFDEFHCLRNSSPLLASRIVGKIPHAAPEYLAWMTVCNGGLLFDTTLLSVSAEDAELGVEFSTLDEYNGADAYEELGLIEGYSVIGLRSYGDPICLSHADSRVYLWDRQEQEFTDVWNCFYDFLADEINGALELIENEDLEPIPIKLAGDDAHE